MQTRPEKIFYYFMLKTRVKNVNVFSGDPVDNVATKPSPKSKRGTQEIMYILSIIKKLI